MQPKTSWLGSNSCTCSRNGSWWSRRERRGSLRPNSSTPWPLNPHTDRANCPFMAPCAKFATEPLIADPYAPLGEQEGQLRLLSEKLNDIEQEPAQIPPLTSET